MTVKKRFGHVFLGLALSMASAWTEGVVAGVPDTHQSGRQAESGAPPLGQERPLDALLAARAGAEAARQEAARAPLREAGIELGTWHVIGPLKDAEYGVFARAFEHAFEVEEDVIAWGARPADLARKYHSVPVPGEADTRRRWEARPEWVDGYRNPLPSGPPPGRNEVVYLYRTITSEKAANVRAYLRTLDAAKAWLNGQLILDAPIRRGAGHRYLQAAMTLPLEAGENRLLVKIVKCFQRNDFSFAIDGLHPLHPVLQGRAPVFPEGFSTWYEPYASAPRQAAGAPEPAPAWYIRRGTWWETLAASRDAKTKTAADKPSVLYQSPILRQQDGPRHVRVDVSGRRRLVLVCTIGGDDYHYDDTIWADPKLIDRDGVETCLTELKPVKAEVGHLELFVNRNHEGKPLKIGDREFARGFWAHAPSILIYDLDARYQWFDTWIGLDVFANRSGTSEFIITDGEEAAKAAAASEQEHDRVMESLLLGDFPGRRARHEMERERADGIWQGIDSLDNPALLSERYRAAMVKTMRPAEVELEAVPPGDTREGLTRVRELYHEAKQVDEAIKKLRAFRFDVEPLPTFDPPELRMQQALDKLPSTPGGAAYEARLGPVREQAREALAAYEAGRPGAAARLVEAAGALDRFRAESIRAAGPILFVRRRSFGRINAVNPYQDADGPGGASIAVFDPSRPDTPPRVIHHEPQGRIWQASLSYDAETVFFAARRPGVAGGWHIYEIGTAGEGLRQITSGNSNNIAPVELPSGEICFVSDRAANVNVCQANRAGVLFVCDRDGGRVRRISANTLSDHTPAVMNDGRIMFTRWDYGVDKGVFQRHGVWAVNPDGTRLQLIFGNTILDPNAFWQCVPVPGRPEVVSTFGGHHAGPYGVIGLLWKGLGFEAPRGEGFRFLTPEYPTYFDDNFWHGYMDPHPLNENETLVSYGGHGGHKNRLYLLDNRGNATCIWEEADEMGCFNPVALRARPRPPVIAPQSVPVEFECVDPVVANIRPDDSIAGTLVVNDVYEGLHGQVQRGEIKTLQIIEQVPKTRPHTGGYAWNISPLIGRGTFYVRRLIGTVPVEPDGSAHFTAPALRDVSFNALDARGRVIQKMGSTTQVMPGERQSCVGCHGYARAPAAAAPRLPQAVRRPPSVPERPDWGTGGIIDYVKVVQPVWDKHCVKCHSGPAPDGGLDLSADKTRYFNMSYDMLIDRGLVHHVPMNGADHDFTTPRANGSVASQLVTGGYLEPEHHGVKLTNDEFRRVYTWIDANVPYYHTYLYTDGGVNGARDRWYDDLKDGWFQQEFAPVFQRRCFDCHKRTVDISDAWLGRTVVTVTSRVWTDTTLMDQGLQIENSVPTFGPEYRINLTHAERSQMVTAPLAKAAGGLGLCAAPNGGPVFQDKRDPDYQAMVRALEKGAAMLKLNPRVDMLPRPDPEQPEAYAPGLQQPRLMPEKERKR